MALLAMQSQLAIEWSMKLREAAELYPGRSWLGAHSTHTFDWTALPLTWYVCAFYILCKPVFYTLEHEPITLNPSTNTPGYPDNRVSSFPMFRTSPSSRGTCCPLHQRTQNTKHAVPYSSDALIQHVTVKPCVYHLHSNS